ncbi:TIGR03619 family F420-dependent LLM class oxidoreductase [Paeniroseomonas aquatica]|uniref:TIGR03619 family F420-dependent LLM class oxidoreductase n=1 Tax=Paeniroseomonas aquatica TaxID=373043 RepID=A0ABT8A2Y2_9PROT|nr:TIGR03619 family F420-dependent LLM class oxidoreductase [Paeniroseomonas aquatica]MDN3563924.1 TIGR03619 family F420-dependent LLM class oxidoreductase [Paeniroseomonas aquatica]
MKYGIHLPHAGEQATPALIRRHAERAEDLGIEDVWVSEHIIVPRDKFPRSPLFFDPVLSLTWAAAATKRIKLGTSVLVLPMRHPLPLAKELATLHNFSDGRLILGAGSGWLKEEFSALGVPFEERGRRLDEGVAMMRAVWSEDPVTFESRYITAEIKEMTMTPMPISRIPLWFGGSSEPALRRTIRIGDGWHGSELPPDKAAPIVQRLRAARPEADFTVSMRVQWDGQDRGLLHALVDDYAAIGVEHLLVAPKDRNLDDWEKVTDGVGSFVA